MTQYCHSLWKLIVVIFLLNSLNAYSTGLEGDAKAGMDDRCQGHLLPGLGASTSAANVNQDETGAPPQIVPFSLFVRPGDTPPSQEVVPSWASTKGHFENASALDQMLVLSSYTAVKNGEGFTYSAEHIEQITEKDLAFNLRGISVAKQTKLAMKSGIPALARTVVMTSAAGLSSRLGMTKLELAYNVGELLPAEDLVLLKLHGQMAAEKNSAMILHLALENKLPIPGGMNPDTNLPIDPDANALALKIKRDLREAIVRKLQLADITFHPQAVTPLMAKFAMVAAWSEVVSAQVGSRVHIPFLIWSSKDTQSAVWSFVQRFIRDFEKFVYHADPTVNTFVKKALGRYLQEQVAWIFAYQENIFPMLRVSNTEQGINDFFLTNEAPVGTGAGNLRHYMAESGLGMILAQSGVTRILFDNLEVVTPLGSTVGAMDNAMNTDIADFVALMVPAGPQSVGGNPALVHHGDSRKKRTIIEQSAMPRELLDRFDGANDAEKKAALAKWFGYFNANTAFMVLEWEKGLPPPAIQSFETRPGINHPWIDRAKLNLVDQARREVTFVGGEYDPINPPQPGVRYHYVDLKEIDQYLTVGPAYANMVRGFFAEAHNFWKQIAGAKK
jgi:hypothetical protein